MGREKHHRRLTDWLDTYIDYTYNSEPKEIYHRWVSLTVLSAVLQRRCFAVWEYGRMIFPNIFTVLVGPSAARKGTAMYPGYKLLQELNIPVSNDSPTKEYLITKMASTRNEWRDKEGSMHEDSPFMIYSEEWTSFMGFKDDLFMSYLREWYDCSKPTWSRGTCLKGEEEIQGLCVTMLGATTSPLLNAMLPDTTTSGGFTSRVLFIYANDSKCRISDPRVTQAEITMHEDILADLCHIKSLSGEFSIAPDFMECYNPWYHNKDSDLDFGTAYDARFDGYKGRRSQHLRKLAMLCCVSRTDDLIIRAQDFERALGFLREAEADMTHALVAVGNNPQFYLAHRIAGFIGGLKEKRCDVQAIVGAFSHDHTNDDIHGALVLAQGNGAIKLFQSKDGAIAQWVESASRRKMLERRVKSHTD